MQGQNKFDNLLIKVKNKTKKILKAELHGFWREFAFRWLKGRQALGGAAANPWRHFQEFANIPLSIYPVSIYLSGVYLSITTLSIYRPKNYLSMCLSIRLSRPYLSMQTASVYLRLCVSIYGSLKMREMRPPCCSSDYLHRLGSCYTYIYLSIYK